MDATDAQDATDATDATDADTRRRRRVLVAVIAVIALIGIGGVTTALLVDDEGDGPTSAIAPGAGIDPFSPPGLCRAEGIATYAVAADPEDEPALTATGAVEPWVGDGEDSQSTSTGEDTKLVAISKPGALPRVVLTVNRSEGAWSVVETSACLEKAPAAGTCTEELSVGRNTYTREADGSASAEPARYAGNATLTACPTDVDGQRLVPRGVVSPVSAYAAQRRPRAVVVTDDTGARLFTR